MRHQAAHGVLWYRAPCPHQVSLPPAPGRCEPAPPPQDKPFGQVAPGYGPLACGPGRRGRMPLALVRARGPLRSGTAPLWAGACALSESAPRRQGPTRPARGPADGRAAARREAAPGRGLSGGAAGAPCAAPAARASAAPTCGPPGPPPADPPSVEPARERAAAGLQSPPRGGRRAGARAGRAQARGSRSRAACASPGPHWTSMGAASA
jgi:hypothetical protein